MHGAADALATDSILLRTEPAEKAGQQEEAPEGQGIAGDQLLQLRLREATLALDRRQGDGDDGDVQDEHELR